MLVAVTGTPGVGKSSACEVLTRKGHRVLDLNKVAAENGLVLGRDEERDAAIIDTDKLNEYVLSMQGDYFLDSHLSHHLDVDVAVVLRCNPAILRERLRGLGWSEAKVAENVEAEAIDVILVESLDSGRKTFEIDTTEMDPVDVAGGILSITKGDSAEFLVGSIDWSEVILDWF